MAVMIEILRDGWRRIRDAVAFAFSDPSWPVRYVTVAAVLLIPVVGYVAMLGWQARVFEHARLGRRALPAIELGGDIRRGITPFINIILLIAVPVAVTLFVSLSLEAIGIPPHHYSEPAVLQVLLAFYIFLTYPEMLRRALAHGERLVMLRPFPSLRAVNRAPGAFFFTIFANLIACVITASGIYGFFAGILLTAPIGHAVTAYVVMEWQRDVELTSHPTEATGV